MVLRGESRRMAQLPDLVTIPLPHEGPTPCDALVLVMRNGKVNKFHKVEYMGAIRNRDPLLCPLSALAFYFFWRWGYVVTDPTAKKPADPIPSHRRLPSFFGPSDYYHLHALPGEIKYPERQWAYEGQRDWTEKLFAGGGIQSTKKTHATRRGGTRHAEVEGVAESQIRRAGRWGGPQAVDTYLAGFPLVFMRKMAGFPEEAGSFYLPRAEVEPPPALTREIYPEVDEWLAKMEAFQAGSVHNEVERHDLAGSGFLRLLRVLRAVFLQDSVVLRPLFPDHPVWKADVFITDAYRAFATQVTAACEAAEEPGDLQVKKALPVVHDQLNALRAEMRMMRTEMQTEMREMRTDHRRTDEKIDHLEATLGDILALMQDQGSGKRSSTVRTAAAVRVRAAADPHPRPGNPRPSAADDVVQTLGSGSRSPTIRLAAAADPGNTPPSPGCPSSQSAGDPTPPQVDPSREPIRYKFDRTVNTVTALWGEWSLGRGSGPSIQQLDSTWGAKWRDSTEKQFYHRRLPIIKAIQQRYEASQASSLQEAAVQLEMLRMQVHEGISLNRFGKVLKEQAAGAG
jgi:Centromere DNA-binding protein complex CBF3 subunit, domain 2/Transcriptional activator of glycolytic enzymes